jgi:hypothetical protein
MGPETNTESTSGVVGRMRVAGQHSAEVGIGVGIENFVGVL